MFARSIVDSDAFLDMPMAARLLYYDLGMAGDDDGFVGNPRRVARTTGATEDDLRLLITKNFIIPFDTGVVVIRHWKMHNYIRADRYTETIYQDEKQLLYVKDGVYSSMLPLGIPNDNQDSKQADAAGLSNDDQHAENDELPLLLPPGIPRLGKGRIGKVNKEHLSGMESTPSQSTPPVIEIPLNDGSMHPVSKADIDKWAALYPAVDVLSALRKIAAWNDANPKRRKTKGGIRRHINSWLSREQDSGGSGSPANGGHRDGPDGVREDRPPLPGAKRY